jgi:hypothetical protein
MLNRKVTKKANRWKKARARARATLSKTVSVTNSESGEVPEYFSIKHAAEGFNTSSTTITRTDI